MLHNLKERELISGENSEETLKILCNPIYTHHLLFSNMLPLSSDMKSQGVHSPEDKPPLFYLGLGEMRRMIMGFKI